jgi:hypothetical protein
MYYANLMEECWLDILGGGREGGQRDVPKEGRRMKWGGFNREGERKMRKLFGGKALYVLLTIVAAGLLMSEMLKWRPG